MTPNYTTVLFDADATLLDFDRAEERSLKKTFQDHNLTLTDTMQNRYRELNNGLWAAFEQGKIPKEQIMDTRFALLFEEFHIAEDGVLFDREYLSNVANSYDVFPDAETICKRLYPYCRLYFATNGDVKTQMHRIAGSGLQKYFLDTFVSEAAGEPKPSPVFFRYCFDHIPDLDKEKTIMIGDSLYSDIKGAQDAGIHTCWFNPEHREPVIPLKPDFEVDSLLSLEKIILG